MANSKEINFEYDGRAYTLTFTRASITKLENRGFNYNDFESKPVTMLPRLFYGAFIAKHPYVKQELTDKIFGEMPNKEKLLEKLTSMYSDAVNSLMDEPEDDAKNVSWEATF